jgi:hypothetical protein
MVLLQDFANLESIFNKANQKRLLLTHSCPLNNLHARCQEKGEGLNMLLEHPEAGRFSMPMPKSQQPRFDPMQHPSTQWNLKRGR